MTVTKTNDLVHKWRGLSTDIKPTVPEALPGSYYIAEDTGDVYIMGPAGWAQMMDTVGLVPAWDPTAFGSDLVLWLGADLEHLFSDTGLTTPVNAADAAEVRGWADQSEYGNNAIVNPGNYFLREEPFGFSVAGALGLINNGYNMAVPDDPTLDFGTDPFTAMYSTISFDGARVVAVVSKVFQGAGGLYMYTDILPPEYVEPYYHIYYDGNAATEPERYNLMGLALFGQWQVVTAIREGNVIHTFVDGVQGPDGVETRNLDNTYVLQILGEGAPFKYTQRVHDIIMVNRGLTDAERLQAESFMASRVGR